MICTTLDDGIAGDILGFTLLFRIALCCRDHSVYPYTACSLYSQYYTHTGHIIPLLYGSYIIQAVVGEWH